MHPKLKNFTPKNSFFCKEQKHCNLLYIKGFPSIHRLKIDLHLGKFNKKTKKTRKIN
jgi:hypothetical protein